MPLGHDKLIPMKSSLSLKGSYKIKLWDSLTGKLISETESIPNLIVSGSGGYGRNLIIRQLSGDSTYPIEIDSASIGTGTNTPADTDTGLQTSVLASIPVANMVISNDSLLISFFITNAQLTNGTYSEFGIFCNGRLFARSLISPNVTKGSNQNLSVDYTITLSSS